MEYAPGWVCRKIADFHPHLRLAWHGEDGCFSLIQLYHNRDASLTYREHWADRGPIFSKSGRPMFQDWDGMIYHPIWVVDVPIQDVFSGKIVKTVKRWATPIASRVYKASKEASKNVESYVEDLSEAMGDEMYYEKQRGRMGNHAPIVAKKFIEPNRNELRYRAGELDFSDCRVPPPPPGGYEKHLEKDQGDPDDLGEIR